MTERPPILPSGTAFPLTALDDFPWHQAIAPFPMPTSTDTRFNDGYYFGFFARGHYAFFGMRLYPNTNVIDGFAGALVRGEQRVVRASRALRPRVDELEVGPLRLTIVEPMRTQRLQLAENDTGVTFDVTIEASGPAMFESPDIHYRQGRLLNHVLRYTQLGRANGTMHHDGEAIPVEGWYVVRDHSWGIRASMGPHIPIRGVDRTARDPRAIRIWMPFDVGDHQGMFALHEDADGNLLDFDGRLVARDGTETALVSARHAFRYLEGTRQLTDGEVTLVDEHGTEHHYTFEVVADGATAQGFGYVRGWKDGEPPGTWRGVEHVETDRFRIDDPHQKAGPDHVPVEKRLGVGEYPAVIRSADGHEGMTQIEHAIYGAYRPYGFA
jgi:hypothetical protein